MGGWEEMAARPLGVAAVAGLTLLGCAFLWELLTLEWVPVARDMQLFFVPQRHLLWESIREGRLPLWTPLYGTGAPFLANFQSGAFYPPHWLYGVLPFFAAFNLLIVFHFVVGGGGMYAFGRRLGFSAVAAVGAAVAFMLGGYFASLLNLLNALQAAAWVPAIGYFLVRHVDEPSPRSFAGLVGAGLFGFLAGEPQTFLLGAAACGALAGLHLLRGSEVGRPKRRVVLSLGAAAVGVAGLSMAQILPTAEMLAESSRASGLSYEEATRFSMDPLRLVHLVLPPDFSDPVYRFGSKSQIGRSEPWLFSPYLGIVPFVLAAFAWSAGRRRRELTLWTVAALVGVLLSLGEHLPAYRWLFEHVPGLGAFRYSEKFFLLTGLGTAMLAGHGLEALRRRNPGPRFEPLALAVLLGALALKVFWLLGKEVFYRFARERMAGQTFLRAFDFAWLVWGERLDMVLLVLVGAVVAVWLYRKGRVSGTLAAWVLVALGVLDLFLAHRGLNPVVERSFYERPPMLARHLPMEELRVTYRYRATPFDRMSGLVEVRSDVAMEAQKWLWQQTMAPNASQLWRVLAADTWDAIHLRRYADQHGIFRALPDPARRERLLRLTSVKYAYHGELLRSGGWRAVSALDSLPGVLHEVADPLPRAYVVPRGTFYEDEVDALNAALDAEFDPHGEVALVGHPPRGEPVGANEGSAAEVAGALPRARTRARIVEDRGEVVRIRVSVSAPGFLVLTDTHYPGWRAAVDGEEREIYLANYFFRAVRVRPGDGEVVFRYHSRPYETGRWISAATLVLLILGVGAVGFRSRRRDGVGSGGAPVRESEAGPTAGTGAGPAKDETR